MPAHNRATIVSMAIIASAVATLLHEGVGHGVVAWLRDAGPTELTTNHLSTMKADRWVMAGGTLVNLAVGVAALFASSRSGQRANRRYFLWLLGALNLLPAISCIPALLALAIGLRSSTDCRISSHGE